MGFGSIARRHIKNLADIFNEQSEEYQIDVFRSGKGVAVIEDVGEIVNAVYYSYENVPIDYDIIFITNPTRCHLSTLNQFHVNGKHFFIEKPICSIEQIEEVKGLHLNKDSVYYVACPLRYTEAVQYIKQHIAIQSVLSARSISSSYLPSWRVGIDYRNTYSAYRELGGGVSTDLIHEWDYIYYLFGKPMEVHCIVDRISDLEINSDDIAVYIARYEHCMVEIHLDYFGREDIRQLQLITKDDTILCDLLEGSITFMREARKIFFNAERDSYQKQELRYFLGLVNTGGKNNNCVEQGAKVLGLTRGIIL